MSSSSSSSLPQDGQARAPGDAEDRNAWFKEMRGWLMVVATVAASVTYQAGLNPPGGFWQDNLRGRGGHRAGNPVLRDSVAARYQAFYYLNSTSFVTSLVIIVLLMSKRFYETNAKVVALLLTTFVDLAGLVGAYIAGSTRYMSSCIYVIVIAGVAFLCVIYAGQCVLYLWLSTHMLSSSCIYIYIHTTFNNISGGVQIFLQYVIS